jgi:hypothetical protein
MKLITVANLKEFLEKTDSEHDSLLEQIIEYVSTDLETAMNRQLEKIERIEHFRGGRKVFALKAPPVDNVNNSFVVTIDGDEQHVNDDYYVHTNSGLVEFIVDTEYTEPKQIAVSYTGGYSGTGNSLAVPNDIKMACCLQSSFLFRRRKDIGINQMSMPDGSIGSFLTGEFLPQVQKIVDRYFLHNVG